MELVYGKFLDSIEKEVFLRISKALKTEKKTLVIVPAQAMFLMEDQIIKRCGVQGFFTLEVVSFERLTDKIFGKSGGRAAELMSVSGASMMVKRAISETAGLLRIMNCKKAMIHEAAAKIILALKAEDITPDMLDDFSEESSGAAKDKLRDLAVIYRKMLEYVKLNVWDQNDAEEYARSLISTSEYVKDAGVIVHGFDALPASRIRTLYELMRAGCDVTVTLEADENDEVFKRQNRTVYALEGAARSAGVSFKRTFLAQPCKKNSEILHIEKHLFSYPTVRFEDEPKNISLIRAFNKKEEVLFAAGAVLDAAKRGIPFSDVGILAGSPGDYMPFVEDIFSKNGINFFYEGKRKLSTHRLATFVLSAVKLASSRDWQKRDVLKHLKCGFLSLDDRDVDELIRYADSFGLKGNSFRRPLKRASQDIERIRAAAFDRLASIQAAGADTDAAGLAGLIIEYIDELKIDEYLSGFASELTELKMSSEAKFVSQVYRRVRALLEQAALLLSGMDKSELYDVLKCGFESSEIAVVPPMSNEVAIGDITHSIFPKRRVLIILGANDGSLPAATDGGIFSEYEVEKINETAFFPGHIAIEDQRLFIRRAFASADELVLSYNDETGPPALIVERMKRIFPELTEKKGKLPLTVQGSLPMLADEIRYALDGEPANRAIIAEYLNSDEGRPKLSGLMAIALGGNKAIPVFAETARQMYKSASASVSRVETFYKCPYRHFIQYGLRPSKPEHYEENALNSGLYVHAIIEKVTKTACKNISDISDAELCELVDAAAAMESQCHNNGIFSDSKRYRATEQYLREEAKRALVSVKKQLCSDNVKMLDSEIDFGKELVIDTPKGKISLSGKIDRADVVTADTEKYVRVIDYKTGSRPFAVKELYLGADIQLAVYLIALIEKFQFKPGCGYYMNIELKYSEEENDKEPVLYGFSLNRLAPGSKNGLSEAQINVLLEHVRQLVGDAMERISSGADDLTPKDEEVCQYCDYKAICRFDENLQGNAYRQDKDGLDRFMEKYKNASDR